jgi:uncharacterized protein YdaT
MSEIVNETPEVDSGYYDRNRATILASIEREGFKDQKAEEIFDLMKTDGLTQDEAITAWNEMKTDYRADQNDEPEHDQTSDRYEDSYLEEKEEAPATDAMSLYEKYLKA